ncbi:MAG: 3'-5' exonuclease [Woeseiaceae bacterium]
MHCFSFDIETVPDVEFGRRMWHLDGLSERDVGTAMTFMRQQATGSEFLPLHLHRIVAISVALRTGDTFRVWSLGDRDSGEAELVQRFFDGIERYAPDLVSWNGGGFDLPVLQYRALKYGIQAPRYWETGDKDREFRYNNYLSRFHWRHIDLMDVLSGFQSRGKASLDQIAVLLGFPGKLGLSGDKVRDSWLDGGIDAIRNYCETDVLNTWLVYLRFEHMRGKLDAADLEREFSLVRSTVAAMQAPHLDEFLAAWAGAGTGAASAPPGIGRP